MATVLKSPGEALSEGLLIGSKIAAMRGSLNARRAENAVRQQQVESNIISQRLQDNQTEAQAKLTDANTALITSQQEHLGELRKEQATKARGAASFTREKTVTSLLDRSIDITNPNLDDARTQAIGLGPALTELGVPGMSNPQPGDPILEFWASQINNMNQRAAADLRVEERKAESLDLMRLATASTAQQRVEAQGTIEEKALLDLDRAEGDELLNQLRRNSIFGLQADPEQKKELEADRIRLETELKNLRKRMGKRDKTKDGLPTVKTQADYDAVEPGAAFIDENGVTRRKPALPQGPLNSSALPGF